jgi:hypothetical protein
VGETQRRFGQYSTGHLIGRAGFAYRRLPFLAAVARRLNPIIPAIKPPAVSAMLIAPFQQ